MVISALNVVNAVTVISAVALRWNEMLERSVVVQVVMGVLLGVRSAILPTIA